MINYSYRNGYTNPKDTLRSLRIYRAVILKQINYFPLSMELLRSNTNKLIAVIDLYIKDYEQFFKDKQNKKQEDNLQLIFEDIEYK